MEAYINMYVLYSIYAQTQWKLVQKFFQKKKKEKQSNTNYQSLHLISVLWVLSERLSQSAIKLVHPKELQLSSCHMANEAWLKVSSPISSPNILSSSWHITCIYTHKTSLFPWHQISLLSSQAFAAFPFFLVPLSAFFHEGIFPFLMQTTNILRIPLTFSYNQN